MLTALVASTLFAVPAFAQYGQPYQYQRPYDRDDRSYGNYAFDNGYRAGVREGARDARDGKRYGYKRDDAYEDADWGFRGGNKRWYRNEFRRGYESGYDSGYRRNARGWYDDRRRDWRDRW
jgi:hypothetical protein